VEGRWFLGGLLTLYYLLSLFQIGPSPINFSLGKPFKFGPPSNFPGLLGPPWRFWQRKLFGPIQLTPNLKASTKILFLEAKTLGFGGASLFHPWVKGFWRNWVGTFIYFSFNLGFPPFTWAFRF